MTDVEKPIIPTTDKAPIWKDTAYPIGAEAISSALLGVPQFASLRLSFSSVDRWSMSKSKPIRVLRASYRLDLKRAYSNTKGQYYRSLANAWSISVCAVPRSWKHSIRVALTESGLGTLRTWFIEHCSIDGREGEASIQFFFDHDGNLVSSGHDTLLPAKMQP